MRATFEDESCSSESEAAADQGRPDPEEERLKRLAIAGLAPGGRPDAGRLRVGLVLLLQDYGFEMPVFSNARRLAAAAARRGVPVHEVNLSHEPAEETERYDEAGRLFFPAYYVCDRDGRLFEFRGEKEPEALARAWQAVQPQPTK